ncbi:formyltransferase family protein [Halegenticoccus soli]|uniref:formyltransferase family protein n=1 Tax=Halegenticoccus soli TaxID=1985678 RepID=UPI000C6DF1EB|nr:formyltransferase family protein [Halegenticoccus soli]
MRWVVTLLSRLATLTSSTVERAVPDWGPAPANPGPEERPVRDVCLLLGTRWVPMHFHRALVEMVTETEAELVSIVLAGEENPPADDSAGGLLGRIASLRTPDTEYVDVLAQPYAPETVVRTETVPAGAGVDLPEEVIDRVVADADVAVQYGMGILGGRVLDAPARGVLSFHHGDVREYRGGGFGFWEFLNGEPEAGVTLQILSDGLDTGKVVAIRRIDLDGAGTLAEVRRRLMAAERPLLAIGVRRLNDPAFVPREFDEDDLGELYLYSDVTTAVKVRYVLTELIRRFRPIRG